MAVPGGVTLTVDGQTVSASGKLGALAVTLPPEVDITFEDGKVSVAPRDDEKRARAMWGMSRSLLQNLVTGVAVGYTRRLEISGVGYRAASDGKVLNLQLGYSHDVVYPIPEGITIAAAKPTEIKISGSDKQKVGQVAAEIRDFRSPEPYKGKGVKYVGEYIFRKEGKKK